MKNTLKTNTTKTIALLAGGLIVAFGFFGNGGSDASSSGVLVAQYPEEVCEAMKENCIEEVCIPEFTEYVDSICVPMEEDMRDARDAGDEDSYRELNRAWRECVAQARWELTDCGRDCDPCD